MNTRLEMLYSEEEEYDRLKSDIRNYYINAMTTATNEEELSNVKKDFNKFQETIKRLETVIKLKYVFGHIFLVDIKD